MSDTGHAAALDAIGRLLGRIEVEVSKIAHRRRYDGPQDIAGALLDGYNIAASSRADRAELILRDLEALETMIRVALCGPRALKEGEA